MSDIFSLLFRLPKKGLRTRLVMNKYLVIYYNKDIRLNFLLFFFFTVKLRLYNSVKDSSLVFDCNVSTDLNGYKI